VAKAHRADPGHGALGERIAELIGAGPWFVLRRLCEGGSSGRKYQEQSQEWSCHGGPPLFARLMFA
jgi:hypothetical protein